MHVAEVGRGSFGGEFGASHFNPWGHFVRSYARATHSSLITLGRTCFVFACICVRVCVHML